MELSNEKLKTPLLLKENNNESIKNFKLKLASFISLIFIFTLINNFQIFIYERIDCYNDYFFNLTSNINNLLVMNIAYKNCLMIISSLALDLLIIYSFSIWIFKIKDCILVTTLILMYTIRIVFLYVYQQCYPVGYLFDYPGIPSICVSYLKTNDFFFSGHVGFPSVLFKEFDRYGYTKAKFMCLVVISIEIIVMIFIRGHYTIDLIFGIIMGFYSYKVNILYITPIINSFIYFIKFNFS